MNDTITRIYFDHNTVEKEDPEGNTITVYTAKFVDVIGHPETAVDGIKKAVIAEISDYDTSTAVNGFTLNGKEEWLDKATRVGLMNSTKIAKTAGLETTVLWLGETMLEVNCDKAIQLLGVLEMYALKCFNVTAAHKKAVNNMDNVNDIVTYDYTIGYPEKLTMTV